MGSENKEAEPDLALGSIFSGGSHRRATDRVPVRIIAKNGAPKWILPANARSSVAVLNSWRPYGKASRIKWRAITSACRLNATVLLPGVASETLHCDLSYWREHIKGFSESWRIVGYIGTPTPTRKALLFFVSPDAKVQAVVKVPLCPASGSAILNEANILERLQGVLPAPRILFRDETHGIAAQSWIGGANVGRSFSPEHLALLTSFASRSRSVRLSEFREEIMNRVALFNPQVDAALLQQAFSSLDGHEELRSCIEHGDFAPWNLRRLGDGQLTLIDWEWGRENGLPWLDVCRYFYLQDFLFRESADVWQVLVNHPLLIEYRRYFGLSDDTARRLTIHSLLNFLCEEHENLSRAQYAASKIREAMERPF